MCSIGTAEIRNLGSGDNCTEDQPTVIFITIDSFSCSLSVGTVSEGYKSESLHATGQKTKNSCIRKRFFGAFIGCRCSLIYWTNIYKFVITFDQMTEMCYVFSFVVHFAFRYYG